MFDAGRAASEHEKVADGANERQIVTWDGAPVSPEPPHGATVVVASRSPEGWQYLLLHRVHHGGPDREGDWAWTPPTGSRRPGEELADGVARELQEEIGLAALPQPVLTEDVGWAVFALDVPWGSEVLVDREEHGRWEWVSFSEARRRCQPAELEASFLAGAASFG